MRSTGLFSLALLLPFAACGGGGDDDVTETPDAEVVEIDAEPPPPDAPSCADLTCGELCVDEQIDEQHCGDCTTVCDQSGSVCEGGDCGCPPEFVLAAPTFLADGTDDSVPGAIIGFGAFPNIGKLHALLVGYATAGTAVDTEYTLDGDLTPPLLGVGYDVSIETQEAQAAFFATAGTIEFATICDVGFSGTATGVTFSAVESLDNPTVDPEGCSFTVDTISFAIGEDCPAP